MIKIKEKKGMEGWVNFAAGKRKTERSRGGGRTMGVGEKAEEESRAGKPIDKETSNKNNIELTKDNE
jgi:hypothetical protein